MTRSLVPDLELHSRFLSGDRAAGGALCARYYDSVCTYFERRLPDQAEDLGQEVFIVYARDAGRMSGVSVRAFFFGIARNVLLHAIRRRSRHPTTAIEELSIPDLATGVSSIIRQREATHSFLGALNSLPQIDRNIIELAIIHGLSVEEVADVLEVSVAACRSRRRRAIDKLREKLAEHRVDVRRVAEALAGLGRHRSAGGLVSLDEIFDDASIDKRRHLNTGSSGHEDKLIHDRETSAEE